MKKFVIALSHQGDYFVSVGENSFKSSYLGQETPTLFDTKEQAQETITDLSLRFVWPDVHIKQFDH